MTLLSQIGWGLLRAKEKSLHSSNSLFQHFFPITRQIIGLSFKPFPNKPWFIRVCRTSFLKTLWKKEKLHVKSNFSFSHSVFYPFEEPSSIFFRFEIVVCKLFQFGRVLNLSFGKGLTLYCITKF